MVRWPQHREVSDMGSGLGARWTVLLWAWSSVPRRWGSPSGASVAIRHETSGSRPTGQLEDHSSSP